MNRKAFLTFAALATVAAAPVARPDAIAPADAATLVGAKGEEVHTSAAVWNGRPVMFVDDLAGPQDQAERRLFAVEREDGRLRAVKVTVGEQEGGPAGIAAIAFANADRDAGKELIVILAWPVIHHDVQGILYEVRLFDDLKPGRTTLAPLTRLSRHFGCGCDCAWRDGSSKRFRFKTVAAVRRELLRLGY